MALPASNITSFGFDANWTSSANASGYKLNVYSLTGSGSVSITLIDEDFVSGLPSTWTSAGYIESTSLSSNIRMASGSTYGKITTSTLDLSKSTTVTVKSKQYSNDTGAKLWLIANTSDTITSFVNAVDNQTFTAVVPAKTATSTLSLFAVKGVRVYVDYVKVVTQGVIQTPVSVVGYPKSVGSVLTYSVSQLKSDSTFYYTVTPEGNSTGISGAIKVHTQLDNAVIYSDNVKPYWYVSNQGIGLKNLPIESKVILFDALGSRIKSLNVNSTDVSIELTKHGVYFLQIMFNKDIQNLKLFY